MKKTFFYKFLKHLKLIFFFCMLYSVDVTLYQPCSAAQGGPSTSHQHPSSDAAHVTVRAERPDWCSAHMSDAFIGCRER